MLRCATCDPSHENCKRDVNNGDATRNTSDVFNQCCECIDSLEGKVFLVNKISKSIHIMFLIVRGFVLDGKTLDLEELKTIKNKKGAVAK